MEDLIYNQINDKTYAGIVTLLDYEISVKNSLSGISLCLNDNCKKKVIIDLALKSGINKYRFVSCDINDSGKILWNSNVYIKPCDGIVELADSFIRQKRDILANSILPSNLKTEIAAENKN